MTTPEPKEHLAAKLIAGLREKLHRKDSSSQVSKPDDNEFPTPKEVAAVFEQLQDKWDNQEAEMETLYRFIDRWVATHSKKS